MGSIQPLLKYAMARKRLSQPGYSYRALARDLGVSPAFVTNFVNGRKSIPPERLEKISQLLEMDIHERKRLFEAVLFQPYLKKNSFGDESPGESMLERREIAEGLNDDLLSKWYYLAVLEGLAIARDSDRLAALGKRLGLTSEQLQEALSRLKSAGAITVSEAGPVKRDRHVYIPSGRSKKSIRTFHEQMIRKAHCELTTKTSDTDFHRRLITGFTFCAHRDDVEMLKAKILDFLDIFSRRAARRTTTDVYQCNIQFFPLTEALPDNNR